MGILFLEIIVCNGIILKKQNHFKQKHISDLQILQYHYEKDIKILNDEFVKNKYLASGKTAYERIHNTQNQSIIDLINSLARESFPESWVCETTVEEFTNFILLIYGKTSSTKISVNVVTKQLLPVIRYSSPYLKNIAVYNKKHKCIMYFDEDAIKEIRDTNGISGVTREKIVRQGKSFQRYNSITINYIERNGHIFIPVIIDGTIEIPAMLDTGASTTVISKEVAEKTIRRNEDINKVEQRKFTTASGQMFCPIVKRKISVAGIDIEQEVAVNFQDDMNLLGVDFFKNYHYITDSETKSLYLWSK